MEIQSDNDYFSIIVRSLNEQLQTLCERSGCIYFGSALPAVQDPAHPMGALLPEFTSDDCHLNYSGYDALGRALCAALEGTVNHGSHVLLLGDSITAGYPHYEPVLMGPDYGDEQHSFGCFCVPSWDAASPMAGYQVVPENMVRRLNEYLVPPLPDMVILQGGANDAFSSLPFRESEFTEQRALRVAGEIFGNFERMTTRCRVVADAAGKDIQIGVMPLLPFYR